MTARRPLAGLAAELARLDAEELPFLTQVDVRADPAMVASLGLQLEPNTSVSPDGHDILWLGPDEWLYVAEPGSTLTPAALEAVLREGDGHFSVVDVSANRAVFEMHGPDRHERLATACPLDLHPRSWGPGDCAQTVFGSAPILLHERPDATRVFVRPSFAGYVVALLDTPV